MMIPNLFLQPSSEVAKRISERERVERNCIQFLVVERKLDQRCVRYIRRLFDEFPPVHAFDRARLLYHLRGNWSLEDAEYVGLYDHEVTDYHVIWDRGWAIEMCVPRELVPKVWWCGYGGRPKFYDRDGGLLFQSVYSIDGKPLNKDERRRMLAEMGAI